MSGKSCARLASTNFSASLPATTITSGGSAAYFPRRNAATVRAYASPPKRGTSRNSTYISMFRSVAASSALRSPRSPAAFAGSTRAFSNSTSTLRVAPAAIAVVAKPAASAARIQQPAQRIAERASRSRHWLNDRTALQVKNVLRASTRRHSATRSVARLCPRQMSFPSSVAAKPAARVALRQSVATCGRMAACRCPKLALAQTLFALQPAL